MASPEPLRPPFPAASAAGGGGGQGSPPEPAEVVREAVLAVPGVTGLDAGPFGAVATYLPGRRVTGVALREDGSAEVAVVAGVHPGLATDLHAVAAAVRAAVRPWAPGPVDVIVADLAVPAPGTPPLHPAREGA